MSLAEELLADFESDDDETAAPDASAAATAAVLAQEADADKMDVEYVRTFSQSSIRMIAKLRDSDDLQRLVIAIDQRLTAGSGGSGFTSKSQITGPIESHPEYMLIVEANNKAVAIDNELALIHKYVKEKYCTRFPELDSWFQHHWST